MLTIAAVSAAFARAWFWMRSRSQAKNDPVTPLTWSANAVRRHQVLGEVPAAADRIPCNCPMCREHRRSRKAS